MTAENAQYISQLQKTKPTGGDSISYGDDHLRAIKTAVHQSFPNISSRVDATPADLNAVSGLITDVAQLRTDVDDIDQDAHGNVASCYWDTSFLDQGLPSGRPGLVYQHNVAAVITDPDNPSQTRVVFTEALDSYENGLSAHYAFNITPITMSGMPVVISVTGPTRQYFSFIAYEWNGSTFQLVPATRTSFSLTVTDMDKSQ